MLLISSSVLMYIGKVGTFESEIIYIHILCIVSCVCNMIKQSMHRHECYCFHLNGNGKMKRENNSIYVLSFALLSCSSFLSVDSFTQYYSLFSISCIAFFHLLCFVLCNFLLSSLLFHSITDDDSTVLRDVCMMYLYHMSSEYWLQHIVANRRVNFSNPTILYNMQECKNKRKL